MACGWCWWRSRAADGTCWGSSQDCFLFEAENVTYRADVTDHVTGEGDFVLTGFPSYTATADTQGAALVVVYEDPAGEDFGTIVIRDGADSVRRDSGVVVTFDELPMSTPTGGYMHAGVGDGEDDYLDGLMRFNGRPIGAPDGMQHFAQRDGAFWDSIRYDLLARDALDGLGPSTQFSQEYGQDCLVFAYIALDIRSEAPVEVDAGVVDGGGADGGGVDGGANGDVVDAGTALDTGPRDVGVGIDGGGPTTGTTGGCGCSASGERSGGMWLALVALAIAARRRRRIAR